MTFVIRPKGMIFYFAPYQLGPYVNGGYHIFVPWSALGECANTSLLFEKRD